MKHLSDRQIFERSITEEDVFSACRALLELNGAVVHRVVERIPWGKKKSEPGIPDMMVFWPRLAFQRWQGTTESYNTADCALVTFVEIKRPGGTRRPAQIAWIEAAIRDGVIAFFASSVDEMAKGFAEYGIHLKGL